MKDVKLTKEQFAYASQAIEASKDLLREADRKETREGEWQIDKPKRITGGWRGRICFWSPA